MKVLLTGGTGFLGSHVARQLIAAGHRVRGLVRQPRYEGVLKQLDVELAVGDVLDPDSLARAAAGVDAVVHAAGNVGARLRDREQLYRVNVEGTQNVLAAARRAGVRRFVHTSSVVAVGTRTTPERMDEDTAFNAGGTGYHYVDSKRQGEELALQAAQDGFEVVVLNPGTMMGPGDVHLTSTRFVLEYVRGRFRRYPGGGMPYCDIRDVAEAHVAALTRGEPGRRYILAGHDRSFRELLEALHALTGLGAPKPLPLPLARAAAHLSAFAARWIAHPWEDVNPPTVAYAERFHYFDCSRAERALGYRTRPLEESLRDTLADFIGRGLVAPTTPELRALAAAAPAPAAARERSIS